MAENVMIDAANEKLEMISRLLEGKIRSLAMKS